MALGCSRWPSVFPSGPMSIYGDKGEWDQKRLVCCHGGSNWRCLPWIWPIILRNKTLRTYYISEHSGGVKSLFFTHIRPYLELRKSMMVGIHAHTVFGHFFSLTILCKRRNIEEFKTIKWVPGSWFPVPGSQFPIPSSWFPVPGTNSLFLVPGSQSLIPSSRFTGHSCSRFPFPDSQLPVSSFGFPLSGSLFSISSSLIESLRVCPV